MQKCPSNIEEFPKHLRAYIETDVSLAPKTWFGVGGVAQILFTPNSVGDVSSFVKSAQHFNDIQVIGACSNVLVRNGGIKGPVIRMGNRFGRFSVHGSEVEIEAGALAPTLASRLAKLGLSGFEFLRGIPGTIGGCIKTNAGAFDKEFCEVLEFVRFIDLYGRLHLVPTKELKFGYRNLAEPEAIIVGAKLKGVPGSPNQVIMEMERLEKIRRSRQPTKERTTGSTFRNPSCKSSPAENVDISGTAWKLIDGSGCRGLKVGGASVSQKHANFLTNDGTANAEDFEILISEIRKRVKYHTGVELTLEIHIIGSS